MRYHSCWREQKARSRHTFSAGCHKTHTHTHTTHTTHFHVTGPLCGNSPLTDEFPSQRPMTRSFDVFFNLRLNKRLCKQSRRRWFETPTRSLWRHYDEKKHHNLMTTHHNDVAWTLMCLISPVTQLDCLFRLTTNITSKRSISSRSRGKSIVTGLTKAR